MRDQEEKVKQPKTERQGVNPRLLYSQAPRSSHSMEFKGNFKYYRDIGFHTALASLAPQGIALAINSFRESVQNVFLSCFITLNTLFVTFPTLDLSTWPTCVPRPMPSPHGS